MSHMRITGNRSILYLSADDFAMQSFVQYLASFTGILTEMHCLDDMHRKKQRAMIAYACTTHSILL